MVGEIETIGAGIVAVGVVAVVASQSFRTIRPSERGLVERFGKYKGFRDPGLVVLIPFVDRLVTVDITENMVTAEQQEIITKDSLNADVDAQVYFKVKSDEESVKKSQYGAQDYNAQIVALSRTTLRAIIGGMSLTEANSERNKINSQLAEALREQTVNWGIEVVRAELKEIKPPKDVQDVMNRVIIAEKEKIAATDFATAAETNADGTRRAAIKQADGEKQSSVLIADGKAQAVVLAATGQAQAIKMLADAEAQKIKLVNTAMTDYFKDSAITYKQLETAQIALKDNVKYIVDKNTNLYLMVGDSMKTLPIPIKDEKKE